MFIKEVAQYGLNF